MKHRTARVREIVLRELGAIVAREMTFDAQLVTVNAVDLTPDFKNCHVFVGVIGKEHQKQEAIEKLTDHRPLLQHELSRRVILKYTPYLHFHLDESVERGTRVMEILRRIEETQPAAPADGEAPEAEPPGDFPGAGPVGAPEASEAPGDDADPRSWPPSPPPRPRRRR